jgi:hypothetical protein
VGGRRLRLAQARSSAHGHNEPLIRHVLNLRPLLRIAKQPALEFEQDAVEQPQQLWIGQRGDSLLERPLRPFAFLGHR